MPTFRKERNGESLRPGELPAFLFWVWFHWEILTASAQSSSTVSHYRAIRNATASLPPKQPEFKSNSSFHDHKWVPHPAQKFGSQNIITTVKHSVQVFWQRDLPHEEQIKLTTETKNYTARQQLCILYKKVVFFSFCFKSEAGRFF